MYKYVNGSMNLSKALEVIRKSYLSSEYTAVVNKTHKCVDLFDSEGNLTGQVYPTPTESQSRTRDRYVYVGRGKGSYEREDRVGTERTYDPYVTTVKYVSEVKKNVPIANT